MLKKINFSFTKKLYYDTIINSQKEDIMEENKIYQGTV